MQQILNNAEKQQFLSKNADEQRLVPIKQRNLDIAHNYY